MDRISNLSDDLLVKILRLLPTKDVVATMLLSKSWKFLWTMVPQLDFDDSIHEYFGEKGVEYRVFQEYVNMVLVSNKAPVLETLKLKLGCHHLCSTDDITRWIRIAIARSVRELEIYRSLKGDAYSTTLPQCLYTSEKLVVMKLHKSVTLEVPVKVCLSSLKSLYLVSVQYKDEGSHQRLLAGCLVLEELVMDKSENDPVPSLSVMIPSLQRLSIVNALQDPRSGKRKMMYENKVVINVPSLKYLNYVDIYDYGHLCSSENMPELVEANVKLICDRPQELMRSITSVKCLSLCLHIRSSMLKHRIEFYQLVHLELCGCSHGWWCLLTWMLESSPKLQVLKLNNCKKQFYFASHITDRWRPPSFVPEGLMYHLNTFEWKYYSAGREAKRLVAYILKNARELKTVVISSPIACQRKTTTGHLKELVSLPRASTSCQLILD